MNDMINKGDKVNVYFSTHPDIAGIVTHIPQIVNEPWHITTEDGDVVYVQQFDYMLKTGDAKV